MRKPSPTALDDEFDAVTDGHFSILMAALMGFVCTDIACVVAMLLRL